MSGWFQAPKDPLDYPERAALGLDDWGSATDLERW